MNHTLRNKNNRIPPLQAVRSTLLNQISIQKYPFIQIISFLFFPVLSYLHSDRQNRAVHDGALRLF